MEPNTVSQSVVALRRKLGVWVLVMAGIMWALVSIFVPSGTLQTIRLQQIYAFTAWLALYLTLLVSPLCVVFNRLPFRKSLFVARRSIGLSALFFAMLHAGFAFFGQLGGFGGLPFLTGPYLSAVILGSSALFVLLTLGITANDGAVRRLGFRRWKLLHRGIYLSGVLILIHVMIVGTHFRDLSSPIPTLAFALVTFLFFLQARRIERWMERKHHRIRLVGPVSACVLLCGALWIGYTYIGSNQPSLSAHASHKINAGPASTALFDHHGNLISGETPQIGRVNVSLEHRTEAPGRLDSELFFMAVNTDSGDSLRSFQIVHEKPMHLFIVDSELEWFDHVHPDLVPGGRFSLAHTFPRPGEYRLYGEFQPVGAASQSFVFTVQIGRQGHVKPRTALKINKARLATKAQSYQFSFGNEANMSLKDMNTGALNLRVVITRPGTTTPVAIQPYLGSLGHMLLVQVEEYRFYHLHSEPRAASATPAQSISLDFRAFKTNQSFVEGFYRAFLQVQIEGTIVLADFDVELR